MKSGNGTDRTLEDMTKMESGRSRWKGMAAFLRPDGRTALAAMGLGALTVFAILVAVSPTWYETQAGFSEFITGMTTFSGYNKEADMRIVKCLLIGIPFFYCLFCVLLQMLIKVVQMKRRMRILFAVAYILWLTGVFDGAQDSLFGGIVLALLLPVDGKRGGRAKDDSLFYRECTGVYRSAECECADLLLLGRTIWKRGGLCVQDPCSVLRCFGIVSSVEV